MVWLGQPLIPTLVCICLPTCFRTRLLGWMLSRDGLARSALDPPTCLHLSPRLFSHSLAFVSPLVFSLACWAGCCHEMAWLGQLFVFPLVFSLACWGGSCHEMVWLGQPFVSPLVRICLPACFVTGLLGWMLSRDGLARSALCLPTCFHLMLSRDGRWSGAGSSLSSQLFPFVSPPVSFRACWAGCCHKMGWLGQLFVSPLVSSLACWAGGWHAMNTHMCTRGRHKCAHEKAHTCAHVERTHVYCTREHTHRDALAPGTHTHTRAFI